MPKYKAKQVLRDLEKKCELIPGKKGSHQKFRNPKTEQTTIIPAHFHKDMPQYFVKDIYKQLDLKLDY